MTPWQDAEVLARRAMGRLPLSGGGGTVERAEVVRAVAELESALEVRPDEAEWWEALGMARQALGEFGPAAEAFRRAIGLGGVGAGGEDDGHAAARVRLASVLRQAGRAREALDVLEEIEGDVSRRGGGRAPEFCLKVLLYAELGRHDLADETYYLARTYDDNADTDEPTDPSAMEEAASEDSAGDASADEADDSEDSDDDTSSEDTAFAEDDTPSTPHAPTTPPAPPTPRKASARGSGSAPSERPEPGCASCDLALAISLVMRAATGAKSEHAATEPADPADGPSATLLARRNAERAVALLLPLLPSRGEAARPPRARAGVPVVPVLVWLARAQTLAGRTGEAVRFYASALHLLRGGGGGGGAGQPGESGTLWGGADGGGVAELHLEIAGVLERGGDALSRSDAGGGGVAGGMTAGGATAGALGGAGGAGGPGDAALVHYREAVRAASTERPGVAALGHLGVARRLAVRGRVAEAAEAAAAAIALDPTLPGAHLFLAAGLLASGGTGSADAARRQLSRELALGPTDPGLLFMAARLADALRRPRLATDLLRRVLAIDPGHVAAMQDLARLRFRKRRLAEGAELTFRALRLKPADPALLHNLALALARAGDLRAALDYASAASDPALDHLRRRLRIARMTREWLTRAWWTRWWRR